MATIDDILKKTNPVASRYGRVIPAEQMLQQTETYPLAYDPAVAAKQQQEAATAAGKQEVQPSDQPSSQPTLVERAYRTGGQNASPAGNAGSDSKGVGREPGNERAMTYSQMYDALNPQPSGVELARMQKQDKARRIIGAIGDGLSAIANMYYVGKGAPSANLVSLSDRYRKIYDDALAKYKAEVDAWRKGKWEAYVKDVLQGNKDREYDLDRTKAEDANRRAEDKLEYNRNKDAEQARYRAERDKADDAYREEVLQERKASNAATQKYRAEKGGGGCQGAG